VDKLSEYFSNYNSELELETNQEMSYMLKVLPSTLKSELAQVLYKDALFVNNFLKNRDDNFYSKYLEELKSERFNKGDIIAKAGNKLDYVYFIMSGVVQNVTSKRFFEAGQMINHECFIKKTEITQDYIAETDVTAVKYERQIF
jgi:CRP-like cAMP-binding protein